MNLREIIKEAAINYENKVYTGRDHSEVIKKIVKERGENSNVIIKQEQQGFITNYNRFVNREEAYQIAIKNRQITQSKTNKQLYSEDLLK